jgi:uncharacterized membrane protein
MTSSYQYQPSPGVTVAPLARMMRRIQADPRLDVAVEHMGRLASAVTADPRVRRGLRGEPIGHALHPLLTDFPLGAWTSTSLLDLFGGERSRRAATGLLAFGVAAALPTAAAGLAEFVATREEARRVAVVHASVNSTALLLYSASLVARRRGRHGAAVALGVAGGLLAIAGGYLGGHLSLVQKVGTADGGLLPGR